MKSNYWHDSNYDLHFYTAGNPEKSCIIFFHGFLGSGLDWQEIVTGLSKDFYCLAIDLPGHGKTLVNGSLMAYSMELFAISITRFCKNLGIGGASLVGYSMGGRLALYLSITLGKLWSAAVFESATPGIINEKLRVERQISDNKIAKSLENNNLESFLKDWYQQPMFDAFRNNKNFYSILKQRKTNNPKELAKALRKMGLGVQPSLWHQCKTIKFPILLLAGEFDRKFCNIMKEMKSINKDFNLKIIENAGHNIHLEQPQAYIKHLYNFLI